jgi:hypothetical protein
MSGFENRQKSYYNNEINRVLPVHTRSFDNATINAALGILDPETGVSSTNTTNITSGLGGSSNATAQRDSECRAIPSPGPAMRSAGARTGCGWWYTPNPTSISTGAYGTRRGPMSPNLDTQYGTGQWIWDPVEAQRLEGMKQTARIASCPDIQFSKVPNVGWCPSTNMALVTDGNGNPAYPQYAGGDCPGGNIIMSANACPPPSPPGGNGGGSGGGGGGIANQCQPNSNGALGPACLQSLTNMSCSPAGTLSLALSSGYAGSYAPFNDVNAILSERGFSLPSGIINDGKITTANAISAVSALRTAAGATDGSRATAAAQNLCFGTAFNPCAIAATDSGPFPPQCITQAALAMGYSQNGTALPNQAGMTAWNKLNNWQTVLTTLTSMKQMADTSGVGTSQQQATAIQQVYGLSVKYPKQGCNNFGVLMYRYFFPTWDATLFPPVGAQTHFLGRYIFKNGFPSQTSTMADQTPAGGYLTEGQRYIANFYPTQGGTYQFLIGADDNIRMSVNDQVLADVGCCGVMTPTPTIQIVAEQLYKLTFDLWNGGGPWAFLVQMSINGGAWQPIPLQQLYMTNDRRLPMIELAFNTMNTAAATQAETQVQDTNNVFQNLALINAAIGPLNGRQCMLVNGSGSGVFNYYNFNQGVRLCAMKSITMMVQINSINITSGGSPSLISFYNVPSSNTTGYPRKGWSQSSAVPYVNRTNDFMITADTNTIYPYGMGQNPNTNFPVSDYFMKNVLASSSPYPANQWFHFAMVWDDDFSGYALYVNGVLTQHQFIPPYGVQLMMEQIRIGCDNHPEGQSWTGGMAWFRAFDYRLSTELIQQDMNDDWANLS